MKIVLLVCILFNLAVGQRGAPHATINLDLPPEQRVLPICEQFKDEIQFAVNYLISSVPKVAADVMDLLSEMTKKNIREPYLSEIQATAKCAGVKEDDLLTANLYYEFNAACTSIVAKDSNGRMIHGRNLDFSFGQALGPITAVIDYMQNGTLLFRTTGFAGTVLTLTAMKPNVAGITVNEREPEKKVETFLQNVRHVLSGKFPSSWLSREVLTTETSFDGVINKLRTTEIAAPIYYTVSGPQNGNVITRNATKAEGEPISEVWDLNDNGVDGWFLLQTNDDHWGPPTDSRRDAGMSHMKEVGQDAISIETMYSEVLHKPPNFRVNNHTIYSTLFYLDDSTSFRTVVFK